MNEVESAILAYVEKEDRHGHGYITSVFANKGYPFDAVEAGIVSLMEQGRLGIEDGYIVLNFPIGAEWAPVDAARLTNGGFEKQLGSQLLNYVSDENRKLPDLAVPDYIKAVMKEDNKKNPAVHSPDHYTRGGIECIDFIEAKGLNFHLGNTVKYVSRAGFKQDALLQDLEKALWYLTREINRLKNQEP